MNGRDFNQHYILSLTGIAVPKKENESMKILTRYLIQKTMNQVMPNIKCFDEPPKHYKDLNDSLCKKLELQIHQSRNSINNDTRIQ